MKHNESILQITQEYLLSLKTVNVRHSMQDGKTYELELMKVDITTVLF